MSRRFAADKTGQLILILKNMDDDWTFKRSRWINGRRYVGYVKRERQPYRMSVLLNGLRVF